MTTTVTALYRYPIKSVGREAVDTVTLTAGQTMPWDRTWAIAHENSKAAPGEWARCINFLRVASSPKLAAVRAALDDSGDVTLTHPERPTLTVNPDAAPQDLIDWVAPLVAEGRAAPTHVMRVPQRGMTDSAFPSVSIANMASHRAVSQRLGLDLSIDRWRSNIWLDGLGPWQEFEWIDRELQIGDAMLKVVQRTDRCMNVQANPETGLRDLDVLAVLESWDHQDFSVLAEVTQTGQVALGDEVRLI